MGTLVLFGVSMLIGKPSSFYQELQTILSGNAFFGPKKLLNHLLVISFNILDFGMSRQENF
jgi:hypothetical protein